jgi:hydrogenase maturation factor
VTGLRELAYASGIGIHIHAEQLPVLAAGHSLCSVFGLDPLGTIASGALLATLPAAQTARAVAACAAAGIACYPIGTVVANAEELFLCTGTDQQPLPFFARDEIVKIFAG